MTLPDLPLTDDCLLIDNSMFMEGVSSCYRMLEYKFLRRRILAAEKPSLNFGSAIHMALEYRYVKYQTNPIDDAYYNDVATLMTDFFATHPPPDGDWRTLNWFMELLRKYNERYPIEDFQLLQYDKPVACPYCLGTGASEKFIQGLDENTPFTFESLTRKCLWCNGSAQRPVMVELPFALHLFSTTNPRTSRPLHVLYIGKIDLPHIYDGKIYIADHKTCSQMGSMFWDEQRMTSQQRGYVWAFNTIAGGNVHGYVINAIRTKSPPQYVLGGKDFKGKRQDPATWWSESFGRERFLVKPNEIAEWRTNTIDLVEEFLWHYSRDYMPQKTKWCSQYGRCAYYEVCQLASLDRNAFLASGLFTNNTWSPLNKPTKSYEISLSRRTEGANAS